MALKFGLQFLIDNVGISFEWLVILIFTVASLIPAAKSFQIALIILMTSMFAVFVWFYNISLDWSKPLAVAMIALVMLTLTMFASRKTAARRGLV